MSDHEGFEMLDETFGVREASEASSSDGSPNSPHVLPRSSRMLLQLGDTGSLDEAGRPVHLSGGTRIGTSEDSVGGHATNKAPGEGRARRRGFERVVGVAADRSPVNGESPSASAPSADVVHPSAGLAATGDRETGGWGGGGGDGGWGGGKRDRSHTGSRHLHISTIDVSDTSTSTSPRTLRNHSGLRLGSAALGQEGAKGHDANATMTARTTPMEAGNQSPGAGRVVAGGEENAAQTSNPGGGGGAYEATLTVPQASTASAVAEVLLVEPASKKKTRAADVEGQEGCEGAPEGASITHSLATASRFAPPPAATIGDGNREHDAFGSTSPSAATGLAPGAEDEAAIVELVGMGFDREHVVRVLKQCGRGESWKEAAISLLLEPQVSTTARCFAPAVEADPGHKTPACPICLSDIQAGEAFTVDCKEQHTFCVDCLHHHCSVQLLDSGLIPACPLSNMTCGHELSQEEVERVFLLQNYSCATNGCKSGGAASSPSEAGGKRAADKRALDTCRTLLTRRGLESTGAIPCVSPSCGNWMVHEGGGQRVKCGSCLVEFCGRCKRSPYHYTVDCDSVMATAREWSSWLTQGKAAFLQAMAARDDEHKALLDQHNKRKQEHDCAVKEAERLRLQYDRMEDWKERRCRCCPGCGRTIEKLSGCDLMVCGVDAHGGNVQNGCGMKFMWGAARPYRGDRGERKTTPFTEAEPAAAARSKHFIADGIALRCDRCHKDVVGPLFRCVHCPSFACCLECQDMACRDPRHVHHTFQVVDGDKQEDHHQK